MSVPYRGRVRVTIERAAQLAVTWCRRIVLLLLLACIAVILLKFFGVRLPISAPGHVELAYLAGAYWLTKG